MRQSSIKPWGFNRPLPTWIALDTPLENSKYKRDQH
jgi:hypothetical protein